ncbi:hypothetical protein BYT27DRAFT_7253563 [Phlegmacium glaucopus]|nr:hypothetical protein BYT27DRAFT_7253563 [Phlegmacium glaucopus]
MPESSLKCKIDLGWCPGYYPKTSQKHLFWLGVRDITRIPARKVVSAWAFGISPEHPKTSQKRPFWLGVQDITRKPARNIMSGWAFGISPEYQPEKPFLAGRSGYYPNTSQKSCFWLGIRDITRKPARKHVLAGIRAIL